MVFDIIQFIINGQNMNTKQKLQQFFNEIKSIKAIDLAYKGGNVFERLFWIIIGFTGFAWAFWFIPDQVQLWNDNPSIITQDNVELSDIEYPAITIVPPGATKYAIAERLGNYLNPENIPDGVSKMIDIYLKCFTIYKPATEISTTGVQTYLDQDFYDQYGANCLFAYKPSPPQRDGCEVSSFF